MKKLLVFASIVLVCACSEKEVKTHEQSLQEKALEQMDASIRSVVADPNPVIEDIETKFASDSVVILHCVIRAHNSLGGYAKRETEYIYGICQDGSLKERLDDVDDIMNTDVIFSSERGNRIKSITGDVMPVFDNEQDSMAYINTKAKQSLERFGKPIKGKQ